MGLTGYSQSQSASNLYDAYAAGRNKSGITSKDTVYPANHWIAHARIPAKKKPVTLATRVKRLESKIDKITQYVNILIIAAAQQTAITNHQDSTIKLLLRGEAQLLPRAMKTDELETYYVKYANQLNTLQDQLVAALKEINALKEQLLVVKVGKKTYPVTNLNK